MPNGLSHLLPPKVSVLATVAFVSSTRILGQQAPVAAVLCATAGVEIMSFLVVRFRGILATNVSAWLRGSSEKLCARFGSRIISIAYAMKNSCTPASMVGDVVRNCLKNLWIKSALAKTSRLTPYNPG